MTEQTAQAVMAALRAGRTLNSICSKRRSNGGWIEYRSRFQAYCAQNAKYAAQTIALQVENTKAANARKGRPVTFCKRGHLMVGENLAWKKDVKDGKLYRYCKACYRFRSDRGGVMKPQLVRKVREAVIAGLNIQQITRPAQGRKCLVCFAILKRYRIEHPEFDRFIIENARDRRSSARLRDFKIVPANAQFHFAAPAIIKPVRKEVPPFLYQRGDLEWISSLIPRGFPGREDVVQNVFMDLCARALGRDEVPARIKKTISEQEKLFPTKYRKFGDSPLESLDAVLFEDGKTTVGDQVIHNLWS